MKYIGEFRNLKNEAYNMSITTGGDSSGTKEVLFADSPFVVSQEGDRSDMYKPCRYSRANIRLYLRGYNFDLYSSTAQQNKVVLSKGKDISWVGYLTSNLYDTAYESEEEVIELEAVDALYILQFYSYAPAHSEKGIASFKDIIMQILKKCNAYSTFYVSDNTQLNASTTESLIEKLCISEENFFDEDGEAMTMQEVLEEICKYLGLTCVAKGDKVFFLDYDAIRKGIDTYYMYSLADGLSKRVTLRHTRDIRAKDYSENGGMISLDNVYNKVTVTDSLYSFDSIIPSIWEDDYLTNYSGEGHVQEVNEDGAGGKHKCFFKYYKHKNYKSYYYDKTSLKEVAAPAIIDYAATQNYVGATICRHFSEKVTDYRKKYNDIDFTDYLLLHCHNTTNVDDTVKRKLFSLEVNDSKASFLGGNTYLIIKGSFRYMDREGEMYIMPSYMNKDDNFNESRLFIWARLQYGSKYWNGTSWVDTPSDFKLQYDANGNTDHCINQIFRVKNNITWEMGLDGEEGYSIPVPSGGKVITGKPVFTLYQPYKLDGSYRCDAVWLSDFDVVAKVQNFNTDSDKDSDTEYSNVINEDYVNDFEDVEFKICTWDNKEANYSAVAYKEGATYQYIDKVYNKATAQLIRPEEQLIYRIVNQYSTPSVILRLNLIDSFMPYSIATDRHLSGKTFVVDSEEIDFANMSTAIKLIEKK